VVGWPVWLHLRWGTASTFFCIRWQVTPCDPVWQVMMLRSSEMGFSWCAIPVNKPFKIICLPWGIHRWDCPTGKHRSLVACFSYVMWIWTANVLCVFSSFHWVLTAGGQAALDDGLESPHLLGNYCILTMFLYHLTAMFCHECISIMEWIQLMDCKRIWYISCHCLLHCRKASVVAETSAKQ